jgi:glyoxylase-like metal-dependent hydrolase (beta-lactamase superfamily II)
MSSPGGCLLIDPGLDTKAIDAALRREGLTPRAVFCTHGHFDHIGSAEHFRREYDIDVHLHDADASLARSANLVMMALKMPHRIAVPTSWVSIGEGTQWTSGGTRVEVLHVPGHTPGSVVLLIDGRVFTGDTLYRRGVWLGSMPETDRSELIRSLQRLWALLPQDVQVYPGHGRAAMFRDIQASNVELRDLLGIDDPVRAQA